MYILHPSTFKKYMLEKKTLAKLVEIKSKT